KRHKITWNLKTLEPIGHLEIFQTRPSPPHSIHQKRDAFLTADLDRFGDQRVDWSLVTIRNHGHDVHDNRIVRRVRDLRKTYHLVLIESPDEIASIQERCVLSLDRIKILSVM